MNFGERLSRLREEKKLTQVELAKLTEISRSRLSLYEINKREPDNDTLRKLADFFNVTTDFLLCRTNYRTPEFTEALHRTDDPMDDLPPEARRSIEEFKELMRLKYKKKPTE